MNHGPGGIVAILLSDLYLVKGAYPSDFKTAVN